MSHCRKCGKPIVWKTTVNGKMQPWDPGPTGDVHFATCAAREQKPLPECCHQCGSVELEMQKVEAGPHKAFLKCADCGKFIQWLSVKAIAAMEP